MSRALAELGRSGGLRSGVRARARDGGAAYAPESRAGAARRHGKRGHARDRRASRNIRQGLSVERGPGAPRSDGGAAYAPETDREPGTEARSTRRSPGRARRAGARRGGRAKRSTRRGAPFAERVPRRVRAPAGSDRGVDMLPAGARPRKACAGVASRRGASSHPRACERSYRKDATRNNLIKTDK